MKGPPQGETRFQGQQHQAIQNQQGQHMGPNNPNQSLNPSINLG